MSMETFFDNYDLLYTVEKDLKLGICTGIRIIIFEYVLLLIFLWLYYIKQLQTR